MPDDCRCGVFRRTQFRTVTACQTLPASLKVALMLNGRYAGRICRRQLGMVANAQLIQANGKILGRISGLSVRRQIGDTEARNPYP
jgi:hypothetical protein